MADQYDYRLSPQNQTVTLTLSQQKGGVGVTAGTDSALLVRGRQLTSLKDGGREMLERSLRLPSLQQSMLLSSDPNYQLRFTQSGARPFSLGPIKGYAAPLKVHWAHYQDKSGQDSVDLATDPHLGLVGTRLNLGDESHQMALIEVRRKR